MKAPAKVQVKLGPNSLNGNLSVRIPDGSIRSVSISVFNQASQPVVGKKQKTVVGGHLEEDLSYLPAGMYQAVVEWGSFREVMPVSEDLEGEFCSLTRVIRTASVVQ